VLMLARLSLLLALSTALHLPLPPSGCNTVYATRSSLSSPLMAGFGGAPKKASIKKSGAKGSAASKLSPKRQWDTYKELVKRKKGVEACGVHARLDDKWHNVGTVAVDMATGTVLQAAQANKRLILEHAARVNPALALKAKDLVAGIAREGEDPIELVKQQLPEGLRSGFEGLPDASGFYTKTRGATRNSDPTAIIGSMARD
jgi:hypothetical protein